MGIRRNRFLGLGSVLFAGLLFLAGCGSGGEVSGAIDASAVASQSGGEGTPAIEGDYRIARDDILQIVVFQVPDFSRDVQVDSGGRIVLPLLGALQAGGKTVRELEAEIATRLKAKYLQNPQVSVSVKDAVGQRVTVTGSVNRPGVYPLRGAIALTSVVALAGGAGETADPSSVVLVRTVAGTRNAVKYDLGKIGSGETPDPPVYGGDNIVVQDSDAKVAWKQLTGVLPMAGLARLFF